MNKTYFMAYNFNIPTEHQARSQKSRSVVAIASISSWSRSISTGVGAVKVQISCPNYERRLVLEAGFAALPKPIQEALPRWGEPLGKAVRETQFEVVAYRPIFPDAPYVKIDAWEARREFIQLSHSISDILAFLRRFGVWDKSNGPDNSIYVDDTPAVLFPEAMWQTQEELKSVLTGNDPKWIIRDLPRWSFGVNADRQNYVVSDLFCLGAIKSSITIDLLNKQRFGVCKRHDCGAIFKRSDPRKMYCTQYCGHLESERKNGPVRRARKTKEEKES